MQNTTRYILIYTLFNIIIYVNLHTNNSIWYLLYYTQFYSIVSVVSVFSWKKYKDNLTRSLIIGIVSYYSFELVMDIINIFDSELHKTLYLKKNINYCLGVGVSLSLLIIPLLKKFKRK